MVLFTVKLSNPGALSISELLLTHKCFTGGLTLIVGLSVGNSGGKTTLRHIGISPAVKSTLYSSFSFTSVTLKNTEN